MSFEVEVFPEEAYAAEAAAAILSALPARGSVVLTGGTTAERIYPLLGADPDVWSNIEILFSDERCVPPDHDESNFKMAARLLLDPAGVRTIHRMRGEDEPLEGAERYHHEIAPVVEAGLDLLLLGMGADAHVGAMFPGSPALGETENLCAAVDRPDGMRGLTLTPPAMLAARKILLLVTGTSKAQTLGRVIEGDEPPSACPARLLADHPDATFLLDTPAASAL
ncbi:MAG: 6-phosphogluconolactonase [Actinomycetota bacterium]